MSNAGTRAERTATKTAVGGLPAPFYGAPILGIGDGTPCRGCGETIAPHENSHTVDLLGALTLRSTLNATKAGRPSKGQVP
jgi:hypothetical protein